jgi:hypothetical protein
MAMNATKYPNNIRTVSGLNVAVFDNDVELSVNTSTLACSINLPAITTGYWNTTWKLYVFDASNNAATNNITINAGSGQTINGASTLVISTNSGGIMIRCLSNTSFIAITTYSAGGGGVTTVTATAPITSSGGATPVISTSVTTNKLIGRATVGTGVMEEITLGTNLSFTGTTLNAAGGAGVTAVTATAPISSSGGATPVISTSVTTNKLIGRATVGTGVMEEITLGTNLSFTGTTLNAASGGGVTAVTATAPISSSGGATPIISTSVTTNKLIGRATVGTGVMEEITLGTSLSFTGTTLNAQAYNTITDEGGSPLTQRSVLNFVGNGVVAVDDTTRTNVTINVAVIQNTVYVMKSGNDLTGLVERFDKPFLTIAAARSAALAYYTSRTEDARVKIIVESGNYLEGIIIDDFIDYDLGNSVISPLNTSPNTQSCISDNGSVYTITTKGQYTAMIYGNATFNSANTTPSNGYYGIGITSANSTNLNLYVQCNRINSEYYDSIFMVTGKATVYANYIYCAKTDLNNYSPIRLSCGASNPPTLSVFNALIFNNSNGLAINACVLFENSSGSAVNKCMLTNCQVGSYSSSLSAISCAVNSALGIGQITLNDTIIYTSGAIASITDGYTVIAPVPNGANILTAYAYGVYARNITTFANTPASQVAVGVVNVSAALIFNQGNSI